eukprot:CAMPEP_0172727746 /NCGR_PEP_ID=MMETSP1074-20121228/91850_1 /TAXON_ID=2916 /ORGANISM="Ceratium fusus, Strain PA161109" /LENGTH=217 /DNA_ID=CAMNT_0013554921 /DNA_START=77 /DNA_END=730 /DNA_ORIENTATION=-
MALVEHHYGRCQSPRWTLRPKLRALSCLMAVVASSSCLLNRARLAPSNFVRALGFGCSQDALVQRAVGHGEPRTFRASGYADGGLQSKELEESLQESMVHEIELEGYLDQAVMEANLQQHAEAVRRWCTDQGAVQLEEVAEEIFDLADDVGLSNAEANCLREAVLRVAEEEAQRRAQKDLNTRRAMASLAANFMNGHVTHDHVKEIYEIEVDKMMKK